MRFDIISIFPEVFESYFGASIMKRAKEKGVIELALHNLRDYTTDKHKTVDDTPYGGGAGMVMKVEPFYKAVEDVVQKTAVENRRVVLFSAKGKRFTQADAQRLAGYEQLVLLCGRYEGVDERVAQYIADEELSIGEFVLTGGELPAMVVIDAVTRLLPGVLGNEESAQFESHSKEGYLEHPQYTKPEKFRDWEVPAVLLGGHHKQIEEWRSEQSKKQKQ